MPTYGKYLAYYTSTTPTYVRERTGMYLRTPTKYFVLLLTNVRLCTVLKHTVYLMGEKDPNRGLPPASRTPPAPRSN